MPISDEERARDVLRGTDAEIPEIEALAKRLKNAQKFGLARLLFGRARRHPDHGKLDPEKRIYLGQQHALCTYKDPELPKDRFTRALEILAEVDPAETTASPETLGLAGAIFKRRWQIEGQRELLERSLEYYLRGHRTAKNDGYPGINAAFLLDLLAREEARGGPRGGAILASTTARLEEARGIRQAILTQHAPTLSAMTPEKARESWWLCATIAEAHFGLGHYDEAIACLRKGPPLADIAPWELESTMQQLGGLAELHADLPKLVPSYRQSVPVDADKARAALRDYLGDAAEGLDRVVSGKLGLGLSGGGFRASLFHIGVLAYLAEKDVLRHVEVLSCVSGGSIIGAHYYLEVQKLLSETPDAQITHQAYVDLVEKISLEFVAGVQTNIRSQVLAELWTNLKAAFWPNYTRTRRIGDLYEERLYARIKDGKDGAPRTMDQLVFTPKGETAAFRPKYHNWRRAHKVPILVLNATTLNTGHNWQFTATWMGEPPSGINADIDGNYRLRRMYYWEAPKAYTRLCPSETGDEQKTCTKVRLGQAVAASACVPGLFEPLMLPKLYPGKDVGLVDGGVFDNQGTASLLEQDCTLMIVSDASGQMSTVDDPSRGVLGVPLRSFSISMARVREAEYQDLHARRRSGALRGLMFLHLKRDLDVDPVDWVDCSDPADASEDARPLDRRGILTRYGIRKDVQTLLAGIRTDLDSFSDLEAHALMTSGYRMAEFEFGRDIAKAFPPPRGATASWPFLDAEPLLKQGPDFERVKHYLKVGSETALKVWRLNRAWSAAGIVLLAGLASLLVCLALHYRATSIITVGELLTSVGVFIATLVVGPTIVRIIRFRKTLGQIGLVTAITLLVAVVFKLHLLVFDWFFLKAGKIARFQKPRVGPSAS